MRYKDKDASSTHWVTIMIQAVRFAFSQICDESRYLVERGRISRQQPIADLALFYDRAEWPEVVHELQRHEFSLGSPICELLAHEDWPND